MNKAFDIFLREFPNSNISINGTIEENISLVVVYFYAKLT